MPKVDPITFAVVSNKLMSIADGMQEVAFRCAVTPLMYEIRDSCFALLDANAGVIAQSQGMVLFLGGLGPATKNCLDVIGKNNLEPGDVIISTVPFLTGSHPNDVLLFTPIFYKGEIFGYAASKTHLQDIGAKSFYPMDTLSIYEEGLHIPPVKLYKAGKLQKDVWEIMKWNSRAPSPVWGDMHAQIAGCHFAEKELNDLLNKYGMTVIMDCIDEMYNYGERMARLAINELHDGTWTAEDKIDNNGFDLDQHINIKATVTVKGSDITVDLTGSSPEQKGPLNGLLVSTLGAIRATIKALTTPKLPANEGCFRPIKVIAPEKCIYNADETTPTFLWSWVAHSTLELICKALQNSLPQKIPACSGADTCLQGLYGKNPHTGESWGMIIPADIGQGADYFGDGENYLFHHGGGSPKNTPIEVMESLYPIFIEKAEFIPDSGGVGRRRGGVAFNIFYHPQVPITFFSMIEKAETPRWGIQGGKEGFRNNLFITSKEKGKSRVLKTSGIGLQAGDQIQGVAGGGCGYGNPLEREPEMVRDDVINGYVTIEHASSDYGVVLNPATFEIDLKATLALRAKLSAVAD
jgi:N-methylhydantoinase B